MPDQLATTMETTPKAGPPTSATSDFPQFKANPTGQVDDKPEKEDKADTAEKSAGESPKDDKSDGTPAWLKREITIERNKRRAAEEKATQLQQDLSRALEAISTKAEAKKVETDDPRPARHQFDDPDSYDEALINWSSRRAEQLARAEERQRVSQESQKAQMERTQAQWSDRRATFMADHPDFEAVAERDDLQISLPMAQAMLESEDGPAVAYYLGQNPETAARIAKLDPIQAVREIGKIEARLSAQSEAPTPSRKPDPIKPVGSRSNAGPKSPDQETMEEYAARRASEIAASRRR